MRSRAACGDRNAAAFRGAEAAPTEDEESRLDSRSYEDQEWRRGSRADGG